MQKKLDATSDIQHMWQDSPNVTEIVHTEHNNC